MKSTAVKRRAEGEKKPEGRRKDGERSSISKG